MSQYKCTVKDCLNYTGNTSGLCPIHAHLIDHHVSYPPNRYVHFVDHSPAMAEEQAAMVPPAVSLGKKIL